MSATASPILSVEHLTMRFGGLTAVDDLSFTVDSKNITAVIGPNGAGKTTVFNCLTGFYKPTSGAMTLHTPQQAERQLEQMEGWRIARDARVVRTFQNIRLFKRMTCLENLLVAQHTALQKSSVFSVAGLLGLPSWRKAEKAALENACHWLERVGLRERADWAAENLPYGCQRRLEIARAMCTSPRLLCLDEPAAGLNPKESHELTELLLSIRDKDKTAVLLIEHDMNVVMNISDHIVVLDYGRKIADGTPEQVRNDERVIQAYLGVEETV